MESFKNIPAIVISLLLIAACDQIPLQNSAVKSSGPNGSLVCGCGADCTSTPGDGIPDNWKTIGIDSDCDGKVDLDLGALGASPGHKDVFVQLDYLATPTDLTGFDPNVNFKPTEGAIQKVVDAFANAPVTNPDGTTGVHLHVAVGNELPYSRVVTIQKADNTPGCAGPDRQDISALKARSMDAAHLMAFHYAISVDDSSTPSDGTLTGGCVVDYYGGGRPVAGSTGVSLMNGTDFLVSLGGFWRDRGSFDDPANPAPNNYAYYDLFFAGSFMHELGHNFGLHHGGTDESFAGAQVQEELSNKPNYISVMNYTYQFGIMTHNHGIILDYSREKLADLHEDQLNENIGMNSDNPDLMMLYWDMSGSEYLGESAGAVDWNNDSVIDSSPVVADINHNGSTNDTLMGAEDWSRLDYGFFSRKNPQGFVR